MGKMKRKMTSRDIANALGISRTTVSRALNGHKEIPEATRKRVLDMAEELGYKHYGYQYNNTRDSGSDKDMHMRHQDHIELRQIAVLIPSGINMNNEGYWVDVLRGVEEAARANRCMIVVHFISSQDYMEHKLPYSLIYKEVDGIIGIGIKNEQYMDTLLELDMPIVFIDSTWKGLASNRQFDLVLMESEAATSSLTSHLISLGHTRIGFIGDIQECRSFYERFLGFTRACMEAGISIDSSLHYIEPKPNHYFSYEEVASALQSSPHLPTAYVCANDLVAYRVKQYLESVGLTVPRDVSITGFDLLPTSHDLLGWLTSVKVQGTSIGLRAFEQLVWRANLPDRPAESIRIATEVVVGSSTGIVNNM
ncbi:Catabolite control protein A [compost metagenome]